VIAVSTPAIAVLAAEEGGHNLLIPAWSEIIWSLVVVVIIAVVFIKYVLPKMQTILDQRAALIEGGLSKADEAQKAAAQAREQGEALLAEARTDAAKTREAAREEGKAIVADLRAKAVEEAARVAESAQRQIEAERLTAAVSLRTEVGELATQLAEKIVGESLADSAVRARVVDRFLADLESQQAAAASGPVG
jgi:F-type H+-transporting ATPase subunit b